MDYLDKLNPRQREAAVYTDGPLMILAGAGSGKTSTMTHRIAYLVRELGVRPYNILAVTFTNKAAGEMRERVEAMVGAGGGMWIMTFHAACLRILRISGMEGGIAPNFVVYDPTDQKAVIKGCLKELNIDSKNFSENYVLSIISDCKEKAITPKEYEEQNGDSFKAKTVASLYAAYESTLKGNNALDFDDLILKTVRLLENHPAVLEQYRQRFRYIMVDEYQDTNHIQYRFIRLLAGEDNNICVVGDDDQCIYQWRGADIRNILNFEKDFKGTKVIKLEQNYRSHANILNAANSVIRNNAGRKEKTLWTAKDAGEKLRYYRADDDREESRYIAAEIGRLAEAEKKRYSQFAVLYRTNAQSRRFEEALTAAGIPYRVLGGFRYYDRKEVKDIMSYMRLVLNPADDLGMLRAVNEPKRGIGEKTLEKFQVLAALRGQSLFDTFGDPELAASLPEKSGKAIMEMVALVRRLAAEKDQMKISDLYDTLLVQTGYMKSLELQGTVEAEGRIENLLEFKSLIYDFEKDYPEGGLAEFMERVALMADIDNHDPDEDAAVLMTLHSAKGLEFPVVFMPGLEDGLFPSWRSYEKPEGLEEERRLCYVGMTRAMERLYLTSAYTRTMYGRTDYTKESVFLRELDKTLVDGDAVYVKRDIERGFGANRYDRALREPGRGGGLPANGSFEGGAGTGAAARSQAEEGRGPSQQGGSVGISGPSLQGAGIGAGGPFSAIAAARAKQRLTLAGTNLAAGDKVSHGKFGPGLVVEIKGDVVTIAFDSAGVKKLALSVAPLKKI